MEAATYYRFTAVSSNTKTGPIPVTTTSSPTCSDACPLKSGWLLRERRSVSES